MSTFGCIVCTCEKLTTKSTANSHTAAVSCCCVCFVKEGRKNDRNGKIYPDPGLDPRITYA